MTININSAYRVHDILKKAADQNPNEATLRIWKRVFAIGEDDDPAHNFAVVEALGNLDQEITNIGLQMSALNFSENLFTPSLNKAHYAVRIDSLSATWQTYKSHLAPETLLALRFCTEILPDEEDLIEESQIKQLMDEIQRLEEFIKNDNLPGHLKSFVKKHVMIIKTGIINYKVVGAKSLRSTFTKGFGELVEEEDIVVQNKEQESIKGIVRLWRVFKDVSGTVTDVNKYIDAWYKLTERGHKVLEYMNDLPPNIS